MRCVICGWIVGSERCPCGASVAGATEALIAIGARVLARAGRGPSMLRWDKGEVQAHQGMIHRVETPYGTCWCETDDLLPDSPARAGGLTQGTRAWGLWLDGRWYPGTIDAIEGPLRRMVWDDGDIMWIETRTIVLMAVPAPPPQSGKEALAPRWDGRYESATVEQAEGRRFRVVFADGEEAWVAKEDLRTSPPNPFLDARS